jgi:hypothetical protein
MREGDKNAFFEIGEIMQEKFRARAFDNHS